MTPTDIAAALVERLPKTIPTDEQITGLRALLVVERARERSAA